MWCTTKGQHSVVNAESVNMLWGHHLSIVARAEDGSGSGYQLHAGGLAGERHGTQSAHVCQLPHTAWTHRLAQTQIGDLGPYSLSVLTWDLTEDMAWTRTDSHLKLGAGPSQVVFTKQNHRDSVNNFLYLLNKYQVTIQLSCTVTYSETRTRVLTCAKTC